MKSLFIRLASFYHLQALLLKCKLVSSPKAAKMKEIGYCRPSRGALGKIFILMVKYNKNAHDLFPNMHFGRNVD